MTNQFSKAPMNHIVPLLIVIFSFSTSLFAANSHSNKTNISFIRAIVGDEIITQDEVVKQAAVSIREAQNRYKNQDLQQKVDELLKQSMLELIDRKVLLKEAHTQFKEDNVAMKDVEKDLDAFVDGAVKQVGSLSRYYEIAEEQGINPLEKKNELKEDIMIDKIMKQNVYSNITIKPKLIRLYYHENIDEFRQKKEINLKHIMIKFSVHGNNKNTALSVAKQILKRLDNGEGFSTLAKKYSNGPHAEKGGLWSFEEVKELREDLRNAVKHLKDNEYSKIIESPVGYHIFKMELVKPEMIKSFDSVQDTIYNKLYREEISRKRIEYINKLKAGTFIKIIE